MSRPRRHHPADADLPWIVILVPLIGAAVISAAPVSSLTPIGQGPAASGAHISDIQIDVNNRPPSTSSGFDALLADDRIEHRDAIPAPSQQGDVVAHLGAPAPAASLAQATPIHFSSALEFQSACKVLLPSRFPPAATSASTDRTNPFIQAGYGGYAILFLAVAVCCALCYRRS